MSDNTKIEWTQATWNPVTGCTRVSPGCEHCYIERTPPFRMARRRFDHDGIGATTGVMLHRERLTVPLRWRKPRRIFVCSLADLFHDDVPDAYIAQVFAAMACAERHTFQCLTKRPARMRALLSNDDFRSGVAEHVLALTTGREFPAQIADVVDWWPLRNVWAGVTVESADYLWRVDKLRETLAEVRFLSLEPLLGPLPHLDLTGIGWVITGGESGPGARPTHPQWFRSIRDQCAAAGVPFLHKQNGEWSDLAPMRRGVYDFSGGIVMTDDGNTYKPGDLTYPDGPRRGEAARADFSHHHPTSLYRVGKKTAGRELDGRTWDQYPA